LGIDGVDHRHRPTEVSLDALEENALDAWLAEQSNSAKNDFDALLKHLARVHPSKYGLLLEQVTRIGLTKVHVLNDQAAALRFVAFVDRAYEQQVAIRGAGLDLTKVFAPEHIAGGYKKKYLRAISRLGALGA
jgi:cell division protein ZapE